MTYDREANQIVMQDSRAWIAGLGDEGGGGAWLAAIMKELVRAQQRRDRQAAAVRRRRSVGRTAIQRWTAASTECERVSSTTSPTKCRRVSIAAISTGVHGRVGTRKHSERVDRSYDYPHVAAAYWVLYRLARNHQGLVTNHPWDWYLNNAYETSDCDDEVRRRICHLRPDGRRYFSADSRRSQARRHGRQQADDLEAKMRARADRWKKEAYPFGSEMPWDSTGQEEVYAWTKYFGYKDKAEVTLNAILGYDPSDSALGIQRQRAALLGFHFRAPKTAGWSANCITMDRASMPFLC